MAQRGTPDIEFRAPEDLKPHPLNDDVYGDRTQTDKSLLASIEKHGVIEPVVIDPQSDAGESGDHPTIISGHRRVEFAKKAGLDQVPVRTLRLDSDLEREAKLLAFNRNRDKTFSQKMREATEFERIERERAKNRQGTRTDIVEDSPQSDEQLPDPDENYGKTRDRVAELVDLGSGRKYDMAKKVWEAAQDGDTVAQHEVDKLDRGQQSVYGAYDKVRDRLKEEEEMDDVESSAATSDEESSEDRSEKEEDDRQISPDEVVFSAHLGTNAEVFEEVLDLHVESGASVADVTYGEGAFWRQVPSGKYDLTATDIDPSRSPNSEEGVDCRDLPYEDASFDCVVLDPPYAEGFYATADKPSDNDFWIKDRYVGEIEQQDLTYHEAVLEMYAAAGKEAHRVLREDGVLIAKMQDEVSRNEQRLTHIEVTGIYEEMGFHAKDLFVVVRPDTPTVGKMYEQRRARKNHSYFLVYINQA